MRLEAGEVVEYGKSIMEPDFRHLLLRFCPDLIFDPASKLGYFHPRMARFQGIWLHERHRGTMDRGPSIPEWDDWSLITMKDGSKVWDRIYRVGWRTTVQHLIESGVPGINWQSMCSAMKVDMKLFTGDPQKLHFNYWDCP